VGLEGPFHLGECPEHDGAEAAPGLLLGLVEPSRLCRIGHISILVVDVSNNQARLILQVVI